MAATHPPATDEAPAPLRGIRMRALLLGFLMCVPVVYAVVNQPVSNIFSLMVAPVSALIVTVLLNVPLRLFLPRLALNQTDLVVLFAITSVAAAVAGEWAFITHPATYAYPIRARTDPTFQNYFLEFMPEFLVPRDLEAVRDVEGGGKGWQYVLGRMPFYLPFFVAWAIPFLAVTLAMLCINSLMRGAWLQRERLTFPLIQLPVAMTEGGGSGGMWRSRFMWGAFAAMFAIDMLNGINYLYPNVPNIPVKDLFFINQMFTEPPWSNIGDFRISIYPFMAAIGIFVPSDLLLSLVVFFLLRKLTHVVLAAQGIPQHTFSGTAISPGPPYFDEQTWGAVLALFLGTLWISRPYLKEVWADIRAGRRAEDGGVKHRYAFLGLIGCSAVVVAFGAYGQLPVPYMLVYFGLFLAFSIVLTRVRAQLGPPTHEFAYFGTNTFMHRFVGNRWLNDVQATFLSGGFLIMNRIYRNHPMPYQLEAMKMGQLERIDARRIFYAILLATVAGFFLAFFFYHVNVYRTGRLGWTDAATYLNNILNNRHGPDLLGIVMTIFGFGVVMTLDVIRFKFPAFPLHPAGYLLSMNFGVDYYWFGLLIALFVKNFVQRYYGLRGYDKLRHVALGILLAEYAAETIWMGMALITQQSTYTISFNDRSLGVQ
jgi:hypothetical protein